MKRRPRSMYERKTMLKFWIMLATCVTLTQAQTPVVKDTTAKTPTDSSQQIAQRIVDSKIPVLTDFWAPWCMPCRMLTPTINELKKKYHGKIEVIKINIDIHRGIASYFGITAIPAVFLIKNKTVVKMIPGLQSKEAYIEAIEELLKAKVEPNEEPRDTL